MYVYVGTFTRSGGAGGKADGIHVFELDRDDGRLIPLGTAALDANPSWVHVSRRRFTLYAACHVPQFEGRTGGAIVAFAIDRRTRMLRRVRDRSVLPHATHLSLDHAERFVFAASSLGGGVSVLPLDDHGIPGDASQLLRHEGEGRSPHCVAQDPTGRFVLATDLRGGRIHRYSFEPEQGQLTSGPVLAMHAGAGPRIIAFHPKLPLAYVVNELDSTVSSFAYAPDDGPMTVIQTVSTRPSRGTAGESSAASIAIHPSGRLLFASNRGDDTVAVFALDAGGDLRLLGATPCDPGRTSGGAAHPRNIAMTPDGRILLVANTYSDAITAFLIDLEHETLHPTGARTVVPSPTCVAFLDDPGGDYSSSSNVR